jgi:hypothetical protein
LLAPFVEALRNPTTMSAAVAETTFRPTASYTTLWDVTSQLHRRLASRRGAALRSGGRLSSVKKREPSARWRPPAEADRELPDTDCRRLRDVPDHDLPWADVRLRDRRAHLHHLPHLPDVPDVQPGDLSDMPDALWPGDLPDMPYAVRPRHVPNM